MGYSYKCYSDTKQFMKKYVNAEEGAIIYGISKSITIILASYGMQEKRDLHYLLLNGRRIEKR